MTKGSFFGEEELIAESPRFSSVHCSSQIGELVFISKKEFQRRLLSEDKIRDYLTSHCKVKHDLRLNKLQAFKNIDQSYSDSLNYMENASMMNKSNSRLSQSIFKMDDSNKRDSLGVNLDISRVVGYSKAPKGSIVGNDTRVSLALGQKHQSIMINSLASLEKSNKTNIFDKTIEGYHPNIGRTTSVFARKSDFSSKATGFSHNSLDGIGLESVIEAETSPLGIRDPYSKNNEDHVNESPNGQELQKPTFESNLKAKTEFKSFQRERGSLEGLQLTELEIRPMNRTYMSPPRSPINRMYKKAFKESFSVNNLPILKELQIQKSASKTHISSKSNILEELKDSFKPREVLKLKAYKRFEELKENFNYFQEFRGQKKLERLGKFEVKKQVSPPPPPLTTL